MKDSIRIYDLYIKMRRSLFFLNNIINKRFIVSLIILCFIVVFRFINKDKNISIFPHSSQDLKYILLWTKPLHHPVYYLGRGQQKFIENNCSINNCYVTDDRNFFGGDLTKFHALIFNSRNLGECGQTSDIPRSRSPHQKYIILASESSDNNPVCNSTFDGFFNWTATYKLDSDIPIPYIVIRNINGDIVGPKIKMNWVEDSSEVDDEDVYSKIRNKSKAAAWFVSKCKTRSGRDNYVKRLQKSLADHGLSVDVFGKCGPLQCPKSLQEKCDRMLERDYYFYLAMENAISQDYVTEKVLTALNNYAVPILLGGAHYSRFLPPGSYLNALKQSPEDLARKMVYLMSNRKIYSQYFTWRRHYTFSSSERVENICRICAALNNRTMFQTSTCYKNFRAWFTSNHRKLCKLQRKCHFDYCQSTNTL